MKDLLLKSKLSDNLSEKREMCVALEFFLQDGIFGDENWLNSIEDIVDFQGEKGEFSLLYNEDEYNDYVYVEYVDIPTYICTAALMKTYMADRTGSQSESIKNALFKGLVFSARNELRGVGNYSFETQMDALDIFIMGGVRNFLLRYPDFCPEFTAMVENIRKGFESIVERDKENTYPRIRKIIEKLEMNKINKIFVYGTLLYGQKDSGLLSKSRFLGTAVLPGYKMISLGDYPTIIKSLGYVKGEVYEVTPATLESINIFKGERDATVRVIETVQSFGKEYNAYVYICKSDYPIVYSEICGNIIFDWKRFVRSKAYCEDTDYKHTELNEYVWYVVYGSNMNSTCFAAYIKGEINPFTNVKQKGCKEPETWIESRTYTVPYEMYYGNSSLAWNGNGVAFIDTNKEGMTIARAYLVKKSQMLDIQIQEGAADNWYSEMVDLGEFHLGFSAFALTSLKRRIENEPSVAYLNVIKQGIKEIYEGLDDVDINAYLTDEARSKSNF